MNVGRQPDFDFIYKKMVNDKQWGSTLDDVSSISRMPNKPNPNNSTSINCKRFDDSLGPPINTRVKTKIIDKLDKEERIRNLHLPPPPYGNSTGHGVLKK